MLKRFLFVSIILSLTIAACGGGSEDPTATPEPTATTEPTAQSSTGDTGQAAIQAPPEGGPEVEKNGRVLGDPDAPVEIVEYGDFQ